MPWNVEFVRHVIDAFDDLERSDPSWKKLRGAQLRNSICWQVLRAQEHFVTDFESHLVLATMSICILLLQIFA